MPDQGLVSVIVPTFHRKRLLLRAVRSVLDQTYHHVEVIVVVDGPDDGEAELVATLSDPRARVIVTGEKVPGPATSRAKGVAVAQGGWLALLDDDDWWAPQKLQAQFQYIERYGLSGDFLLSCCTFGVAENREQHEWPPTVYHQQQHLSEYLFDRPSPRKRPGFMPPGTLLFPRSIYDRVPFPLVDRVHEDLGWLLRCADAGIPVYMVPEYLFYYSINSTGARNPRTNWQSSLEFAERYRKMMTPVAFAGFVSSMTAWRGRRQDGISALGKIAVCLIRFGSPRFRHWLSLSLIAAIPPSLAERLRRSTF